MPVPLPRAMAAVSDDAAANEEGRTAQPRKTMHPTKANIDFSRYLATELRPVAQVIHDKMLLNAATFASPPVSMPTLQTKITTYEEKLVLRASRASADVLACKLARESLEEALRVLGNYVNGLAKGAAVTVDQSGFPSYQTIRRADTSPPGAPLDLRLRQGSQSGSIVARYRPERGQSTNEVQTNLADPNTEADWHMKGIYQGGRAELDGYTPGSLVWVRVRTVGLKGVMGAWSDPAQIRVI